MRIFREYGADQQSLFGGEAKSQALGALTYTKALRLLALPDAEEREKFLAEHDVSAMSTRELEQALKDREAALAEAASAREAREKMEKDMAVANAALRDQTAQVKKLRGDADGLQRELEELRSRPADGDTAAFRVLYESWQETGRRIQEALERIAAQDSGKAEKLRNAVRAAAERLTA